MKCPECGIENSKVARYCGGCGSKLSSKKFGEFTSSIFINMILWMIIASIIGEIYAIIALSVVAVILGA